MSAPLVVNTRDGACWTRRAVTAGGIALYAPEAVKTCPEFVMATLEDLAAHGIVGSADALPMPVGPALVSEAELDSAMQELTAFLRVRLALESAQRGRRELRAQVAGLLAERTGLHGKLDALDDLRVRALDKNDELRAQVIDLEAARDQLVRWHGEDTKTITTLVARVDRYRARATALQNDALSMRGSLSSNGEDRKVPFELGETLTPAVDWLIARVVELEAQREALAARLRKGQRWQEGRVPPLVSQDFVSQDELRSIFGIELTAPWETSEAEAAAVCRCDEPGADPYACEADDCTGEFSELNPFGGARPVNEPSAEVSRKCDRCDWRTSVWHVDDGSADEELHRHIARAHGSAEAGEAS
ncbi:hypothetical protein [Streptomyces sp. ME01-18h]|uniref:hypothetical protein n=1 Tax=Streptomyces sp. ME01-18h TaxID=462920 RepID=UPI0029A9ACA9|nr:hypothetical protein [Streptomyces sp. ME01-18h]MDX3398391.1 hypothetical protein [Streptomyces sp. ME01-18h]